MDKNKVIPFVEVMYHPREGYMVNDTKISKTFPYYKRKSCIKYLTKRIAELRKIGEVPAKEMAICICVFARSGKTHRITCKDYD